MGPFNVVVYRDNTGYHAVQVSTGTEIAADPDRAGPVIQAALDQPLLGYPPVGPGPGDIYLRSGHYRLESEPPPAAEIDRFSGLTVHHETRLMMDRTAYLEAPSGYGGPVFLFHSNGAASKGVNHVEIIGGRIVEISPVQRQWTAFQFLAEDPSTADRAGLFFIKISDTVVYNPGIGIALHCPGPGGFISSSTFENLRIWLPKVGIDFSVFPGYQPEQQTAGIIFNNFTDLHLEHAGDATVYQRSIQGVTGFHNSFHEVKTWDVPKNTASMSLDAKARETLIIGGTLGGTSKYDPGYITGAVPATETTIIN